MENQQQTPLTKNDIISQIRHVMLTYSISPKELVIGLGAESILKRENGTRRLKALCWRDPVTNKFWNGQGRKPKWFNEAHKHTYIVTKPQ